MEKILWIFEYNESERFFAEFHEKFQQTSIVIIDEGRMGRFEKELILQLKARYPNLRIIYLCEELDKEKKVFLFKWNVYDILLDSKRDKLNYVIKHPKILHDVGITLEVNHEGE